MLLLVIHQAMPGNQGQTAIPIIPSAYRASKNPQGWQKPTASEMGQCVMIGADLFRMVNQQFRIPFASEFTPDRQFVDKPGSICGTRPYPAPIPNQDLDPTWHQELGKQLSLCLNIVLRAAIPHSLG